jgi:hypothetical protein
MSNLKSLTIILLKLCIIFNKVFIFNKEINFIYIIIVSSMRDASRQGDEEPHQF